MTSPSFSLSNSLLYAQAALRSASIAEHQWGMGERYGHPIPREVAEINWCISGFGQWFTNTFDQHVADVRAYFSQRANERPGELPKVTASELHQLLGSAQVRYDDHAVFTC